MSAESANQRTSQMLKGALDLCILALLKDGPLYGYAVVDALAGRGLDLVAEGSIYPLLTRMEKAGFLNSFKAPSPEGPPRKYYELSPAGSQELERGHAQWRFVSEKVSQLLESGERTPSKEVNDATHR